MERTEPTESAAPDPFAGLETVVSLRGVRRSFGDKPALQGLDLTVPKQRITVLLGPNGAGKTTAIRMITGALNPDGGDVRVFGLDPGEHGAEVRSRCGVVSAKPALYDRLSGFDNLAYAAELYDLGRGDAVAERIRESAARFGIEHALDKQVGGYSTGMKTRLALARSILHRPELLLFDEPTSGLDPESSHAVLEMVREMTDDGRTVVMCTHLLLEAEGLAEQVVVLEDGKDLIAGTPDGLTRRFWPHTVVRLESEDPAKLDMVADVPGVRSYQRGSLGRPTTVQLDDPRRVPDLIVALTANGVRLTRVEPHTPTLEDLYFAVRSRSDVAEDGGRQLSPRELAAMAPAVPHRPDAAPPHPPLPTPVTEATR